MSAQSPRPMGWRELLAPRVLALLLVALPAVAATVYYGMLASDVYISESRFVVRSSERGQSLGAAASLLQSTGLVHSQDDTYYVHDYLLSRDALSEADRRLGLRSAYSSGAVDVLDRFPGLSWDHSFEAFYRYFGKRISVEIDTTSAISVLRVRAFDAGQAHATNRQLLDQSERLINLMNERSRADAIRFAQRDVDEATAAAATAAAEIARYRGGRSVYEPNAQASLQMQGVARLEAERVAARSQLDQVLRVAPDSPQLAAVRGRIASLDRAIGAERARIVSAGPSLSGDVPEFQRLSLASALSEKRLGAAVASLETARSEAQRRRLYLDVIVNPSLPDHATEPRRLRSIITVLMIATVVWGIGCLLLASIQDHLD